MKKYLVAAMMPPVGACRYGCGTNCAPPIAVFWLFGVISVIYGLLGGPTDHDGISWGTVGLGLAMWGISAVWTLLTVRGVEHDRCHDIWSPRDHQVSAEHLDDEDPLEQVRKSH